MFDSGVKYLNILTKKLCFARLLTHKPDQKKSMIPAENLI